MIRGTVESEPSGHRWARPRFWQFSQGSDSLTLQRSFNLRHSLQEDGSGPRLPLGRRWIGLDDSGGDASLEPMESCCGD